jgi:hypothetical protein
MTWAASAAGKGCLLGTNEVLVADSVVTPEEQSTLVSWVDAQYREGKLLDTHADGGVYSTPFHSEMGALTELTKTARDTDAAQEVVWVPEVAGNSVEPLPREFWDIRARVVSLLGLGELQEDSYKGSFLSYIAPGAGIHTHRDGKLIVNGEERLILRCNILVRKPAHGGLPLIESTVFDVPDLGMWAFFPTEHLHSATPVGGSQFRVLASFGFLVAPADVWERRFRLGRSFAVEYGLDGGPTARRALLGLLRSAPEACHIGQSRLDLVEFILTAAQEFSIREAAEGLGRSPEEIWEALRSLQKSGLVESNSSMRHERGKVTVL